MQPQEHTRFYCPPQYPGVERFKATISHRSFPPHAHEGFVIGIVQRGVQVLQHEGREHHVPEGSVVFLNPDELHSVCAAPQETVTYQTLHVPASMVHAVGGASFRFMQTVEHAPRLVRELWQQFESLDNPLTASAPWLEQLFELLTGLVGRQGPDASSAATHRDGRIHRLIEYIDHHLTSPMSLVSLASEVQLSPQHLVRSFKQSMGMTPHSYIQARRAALAKQLLRTSAPADAAASAGFADQSHLTRWMKACYGTTPAAYRRLIETARTPAAAA